VNTNTEVDPRFDDAEAELRRGMAWKYREPGAPNPLTLIVTGWSEGHTKHGPAEFLNGIDRDGNAWSVLVGSTVLKKRLIDGEVSEWDNDRQAFIVTDMQGRVAPGDVVSIRYLGDKENAAGTPYAAFNVSRRGAAAAEDKPAEDVQTSGMLGDDEELPF
jgi:hypothetical protein